MRAIREALRAFKKPLPYIALASATIAVPAEAGCNLVTPASPPNPKPLELTVESNTLEDEFDIFPKGSRLGQWFFTGEVNKRIQEKAQAFPEVLVPFAPGHRSKILIRLADTSFSSTSYDSRIESVSFWDQDGIDRKSTRLNSSH